MTRVQLELLVLQGVLVLLVQSDPLVNRETEERRVPMGLLDLQGLLELGECLDHKDRVEIKEKLGIREIEDRKDTEASLVSKVCLGLLVNLVIKVLLDPLDLVEQEDPQALSVQLEKMEQTVYLDPLDPRDPVVVLGRLVHQVLLELLDPLVLLALRDLASTCQPLLVCLSLRSLLIP